MSDMKQRSYLQVLGQLSLVDIYIRQMFDYYRECLEESEEHQQFVMESSRIPEKLRDHRYVGICNRTLGTEVPVARNLEGGAMRGSLQTVGLIHSTGGELFRNCIVFPEMDDQGNVVSAVGYRYGDRIRSWQKGVIHWEKPTHDGFVKQGLALVKEVIYGQANQQAH